MVAIARCVGGWIWTSLSRALSVLNLWVCFMRECYEVHDNIGLTQRLLFIPPRDNSRRPSPPRAPVHARACTNQAILTFSTCTKPAGGTPSYGSCTRRLSRRRSPRKRGGLAPARTSRAQMIHLSVEGGRLRSWRRRNLELKREPNKQAHVRRKRPRKPSTISYRTYVAGWRRGCQIRLQR